MHPSAQFFGCVKRDRQTFTRDLSAACGDHPPRGHRLTCPPSQPFVTLPCQSYRPAPCGSLRPFKPRSRSRREARTRMREHRVVVVASQSSLRRSALGHGPCQQRKNLRRVSFRLWRVRECGFYRNVARSSPVAGFLPFATCAPSFPRYSAHAPRRPSGSGATVDHGSLRGLAGQQTYGLVRENRGALEC